MGPDSIKKIYARIIKVNATDADDQSVVDFATLKFNKTNDEFADVLLLYGQQVRRLITDGPQDQRNRVLNLFKVTVALDKEAGEAGLNPAVYVGYVMIWNEWFGESCASFKKPPMTLQSMVQLVKWILDKRWDEHASFAPFCQGGAASAKRLIELHKKVTAIGLTLDDIQTCVHFLHQHQLRIETLKDTTIESLNHLRIAAPPASDAIVFTRWGSGDARGQGDLTVLNSKNHFLKHVLDAHPDASVKLDWPAECSIWWKILDIKLPDPLPQPVSGEAFVTAKRQSQWAGDQLLKDQLVATYEPKYKQYVLDLCARLQKVVVHTDASGGNVYVMGYLPVPGYTRVFFVGGRLDGPTVGISTCFIPNDNGMQKVAEFESTYKIWQVSK